MMINWTENRLSDTVVEFKATITRKRNTINELIIAILIIGLLIYSVIYTCPVYIHILSSCIVLFIIFSQNWIVSEESVLILRDFGIQLRMKYANGSESTEFLDRDKIASFFIHEAIVGSKVKYQLAFMLHGENKLALAFKHVYPGLNSLQTVYMSLKKL